MLLAFMGMAVGGTPLDVAASARHFRARAERLQAERQERTERLRNIAIRTVGAQLPPEARAWLIGSLAWGGFGERSDVDLVLEGVDGPQATAIETLLSNATDLHVDILHLEHLPASFQRRVVNEGVAIRES
jgi:predicted nucleotidyltransferase